MATTEYIYLLEELDHELDIEEQKNKVDPFVGYYEEGDIVYYNWIEPQYTVADEIERGVYTIREHQDIEGSTEETGYTVIDVQEGN